MNWTNNSESPAADRHSWPKVYPIIDGRVMSFEIQFDGEQYRRLALGFIPRQMEDKWFVFMENDSLFFHRSWTGTCIYVLEMKKIGNHYIVSSVIVGQESKDRPDVFHQK